MPKASLLKTMYVRAGFRAHSSLPLPFHLRSTGCYEIPEPDWNERFPARNFVQIFWIKRGMLRYRIPDGREMEAGPDTCFYSLPDEPQILRGAAFPLHYRWITFDGAGAEAFLKSYGYPRKPLSSGPCPDSLFQEAESLIRETTPSRLRHSVSVVTEILGRMGGQDSSTDRETLFIREVLEIIRTEFSDPVMNVNAMACRMGVHRTTLSKFFRRKLHVPPGKWLLDFRIQEALTLLRNTDRPIHKIARMCGIPDPAYFARAVKRSTGKTPQEWRRDESI